MTCIIGYQHEGGVLLAADTQGTAGLSKTDRDDSKLYRVTPEIALGFTTSYRMGQLLGYGLEAQLRAHVAPKASTRAELHRWMVTVFVEQCRTILKDGGFARIDSSVETGGMFLVAAYGYLFEISSDFQVASPRLPYEACGCGYAFAVGAMHATRETSPIGIVRAGMHAAAAFSAGVGGRMEYLEVLR